MMVASGEFYKDLERTKAILDDYCIFKNLYREEPRSELAKCGYENYESLRTMLEDSCEEHVTVILGTNSNTKIYDFETGEFVSAKFRRCLCCGKQLPLEIKMKNDIDCSDDDQNVEINPGYLQDKFFEILDEFINAARRTSNKEEAIEELKKIIAQKKEEKAKLKKIS